MLSEVEDWVRAFLEAGQEAWETPWEGISQVDGHADHATAACVLTSRAGVGGPTRTQVALVDLYSGAYRLLQTASDESRSPSWSPDGRRLAVITSATGRDDQVSVIDGDSLATVATSDVDGTVERVHWSPDGNALALVVAEAGAEVSDVHGSGVVGGATAESWRPRVLPGSIGRRHLVVWDVGRGRHRSLVPQNVWEAGWLGTGALLALVSDGPGEDDWYTARLVQVDRLTGEVTALLTPVHQLAQPRGSHQGDRWSVLSGAASDREMLVGSLLVGSSTGAPAEFDTSGVHVSDHRWLDSSTILFIGLRGQETVMGALDPSSGEVDELWTSHQTTGRYQPELGGWSARGPLIAVEDHHHPPALAVVSAGSSDIVLRASGRGLDHLVAHAGRRSALSWEAGDGTLIQGYLTLPDRPAPHPLVVDVHGGPIGAVRNTWAGRDPYLSVLVARGYAVLQPNPRGSTGRGAAFAQAVVGDMGGTDVDDILTGVRLLVEDGVADGERLGITGVSYGGYMSAWIPCLTQMFKAGVSRSPCTDWVLMYLTSNIGEFVRIFVDGDPSDPDSQYRTRSPLQQADRIRTPLLFTAGLRDLACPPSQAHTMYSALVQRGVDAGLVVYPEEGHDVKRHEALIDQCARLVEWFERYLPAQSG